MAKKSNEHYITIQEFMVSELELCGNELIAYALIYGFSQDGESCFKGSLSYVSKWLNCSKTTAFNILNKLAEDGFLKKKEKTINGVKLCDYMAYEIDESTLKEIKAKKEKRKEREKSERRSKKLNTNSKNYNGRSKKLNGGVQKVDTHNNIDILKDNIDDNTGIDTFPDKSEKGDDMYTSLSDRKEEGHSNRTKPSRYIPDDYTEEQLREHIRPIIKENFERIEEENGLVHFEYGMSLFEDVVVEFYRQYEKNTGVKHRIVPDKTLIAIIERYITLDEPAKGIDDFGTYKKVIEHYFNTDFNKRGEYNGEITLCLSHFMTNGIINYLLNREGILWERCCDDDCDY